MNTSIPVIDLTRLGEQQTQQALDLACRDWGLFYLINHGIGEETITGLLKASAYFFEQPSSEKRKISRSMQNPWGFFDQELTKNTRDWKEIFDYGPEYQDVQVPRWPDAIPAFQKCLMNYYQTCEQISFQLLETISINLSMPAEYLNHLFEPEHTSFARVNYYPNCPNPESPVGLTTPEHGYQGVNHHTDAGALTILLQDNQPGLEIIRDNEWHLIAPRSDAVLVNIGDITQVWSNDRYPAPLHRVRASDKKTRYSVPFFFNPAFSADFAPLPGTINEVGEAHYTAINWGRFRSARAAGDYDDFGEEIQIGQFRTVP